MHWKPSDDPRFSNQHDRIRSGEVTKKFSGMKLKRSVDVFPSNPTAFAVVRIEPAAACRQFDRFGSDDCHFVWGTKVIVNYEIRFGQTIESEDYLEGHFMLDGHISYSFKCKLCGEDCKLDIPIINAVITIPLEKSCPIPNANITRRMAYHMWHHSPTDGLITTKLEGKVVIVQGSTGTNLAGIRIDVSFT
ncbi:hypothetical protein ACA910_018157 [Epithemia clementina (nom. ined.)]